MGHREPDGTRFVTDFTPGYLDSPESDSLPLGATPDAKNAFLYNINTTSRRAVMGKRPGCRLLNPAALVAATRVDGLFEFRRSGAASELLAICDGDLRVWDTVDDFDTIAGPWTPGNTARMTPFRNNAFIYDGAAQQRYDGTDLFAVGLAAPTAISNMSAGAGTLTGTYEAIYTWYNSAMDHHSSPSDATATQVLAGQGRTHTKPSSAQPAAATHWGLWVRRTDTNEVNYYHAGNVVVASGSTTETVSDVVRQRSDLAPKPSENDPPPGAFIVLEDHKGYGIGILPNSDSYYVSKIGDFESWHPRNKFPVSRAAGEDLAFAKKFGLDFIIGTGHRSWVLVGDGVPFRIESWNSRYGCVSQDAGMEIGEKWYAWDRVHGPYVSDGVNFRPLGRHRIDEILATVNKDAVGDIRIAYSESLGLVGWAVPVTGATRRRTILWYSIDLDSWLPPHTGMEYASFSEFTDADGDTGLYMGDYWGRVFELFSGTTDGVPTSSPTDNLRSGTVVSATSGTLVVNDSAASLYTAGNGLAGLPVAVKSPAGVWQWRRVLSNTGDTITLDTTDDAPWSQTPEAGWHVVVGGIEWWWWTPAVDFDVAHIEKKYDHFWLESRATGSAYSVDVRVRLNSDSGAVTTAPFAFSAGALGGIWGESLWGQALWAGAVRTLQKQEMPFQSLSVQMQVSNFEPGQDIRISRYGITADVKTGRKAPSVGAVS